MERDDFVFSKTPKIIKNLNEYIKEIDKLNVKKYTWFRGQGLFKKYQLSPSIYRPGYVPECEVVFLNKFKSRAIPYLKSLPQSDWEWFFIMQHYTAPTRLLDWSESPLAALFFALDHEYVKDPNFPDDGPVIWCINPIDLNKKFVSYDEKYEIPNITSKSGISDIISNYYDYSQIYPPDHPIAIRGPLNSSRINAQKGVFTLFPPKNTTPLEKITDCNEYLEQILIEPTKIDHIKEQLFNLGITYATIYPDLDSIAKDIMIEYKFKK